MVSLRAVEAQAHCNFNLPGNVHKADPGQDTQPVWINGHSPFHKLIKIVFETFY